MNRVTGSEIYIGLMSGTSLDGIDVAIIDFTEFPPKLLHCETTPYAPAIRQRLHALCQESSTTLDNLYSLDAELGELYAASVNQALELASVDRARVIAIGCHGQTIRHSPDSVSPYTAQIGDPNRIAALTDITTVADFRRKDIALGGQAAPLAPAFHRFLFQSKDEDRALIDKVIAVHGAGGQNALDREVRKLEKGHEAPPELAQAGVREPAQGGS